MSAILWSVHGWCNSAIYKDKDEAANRGGLPVLRALFFFEATIKSVVAIPAAPNLHRESLPPLCEPGLMGLTSRQARFVSGPLGRFGEMGWRTGRGAWHPRRTTATKFSQGTVARERFVRAPPHGAYREFSGLWPRELCVARKRPLGRRKKQPL
jgi:hypothetical protein